MVKELYRNKPINQGCFNVPTQTMLPVDIFFLEMYIFYMKMHRDQIIRVLQIINSYNDSDLRAGAYLHIAF